MAVNLSLTNLTTLQNDSSAVAAINANSAAITTAFQDVLALDGTAPNQMQNSLDMNSNQIINLPAPSTVSSPVRLQDVATNPTITVPPVGTSGAVVPLLSTANTWSGFQGFSRVGFNTTAPIAKPTVTGSKGANAALTSLMTALAAYGLVVDSTT